MQDLNWGAFDQASHAPQLRSCNYYIHVHVHNPHKNTQISIHYANVCTHTHTHTHTHTGCDQSECLSDTWAFNFDTNQWLMIVNTSALTSPYPQARFTTAGGVYPGQNELWLSMGETNGGRKLSDTWILRLNIVMDGTNVDYNGMKVYVCGSGITYARIHVWAFDCS